MPTRELSGTTALVTGASRGFGRAISIALADGGAHVVGVARGARDLEELAGSLGDRFTPVPADATDPAVPGHLIDEYQPQTLVLNAGAVPLSRPLQHHTWDTFSRNWEADVQHVFRWTREALLAPLAPGSTVIALSSGAAIRGSQLSGGYAGAKATIKFIASYAAAESTRGNLGIQFASVLPKLTPATAHGIVGVKAYAKLRGVDVPTFLADFGPTLVPEQVGKAILELAGGMDGKHTAYLLGPGGLEAME
jgi:NAD(P)-dependent dehydrogenase (short-subunit alcohol dehydrogenase family)